MTPVKKLLRSILFEVKFGHQKGREMSSDGVAVESSARSSSIVWFTRAGVRDLPEGPREVTDCHES